MIKFRCTTLWQLISIVRAATLELKASALRRAIEERYRADQPRAPRGTPIGGQWIDDVTHVAARKPRPVRLCEGLRPDAKWGLVWIVRNGTHPSQDLLLGLRGKVPGN